MMGLASTLMGVLPTYASVGLLAPALLVLLRLIQGFGAGAEFAGAGTMTIEYAGPARRGRAGAVPATGAAVGSLLSALSFAITTNLMSGEAFLAWGWRIPFLVSIVLVGVGLYMRFQVNETPEFRRHAAESTKARVPLVDLLRNSPRRLVLGILASNGVNVGYYLPSVFGVSYITQNTGVGRGWVTVALVLASGVGIFGSLLAGRLPDRWGAKRVYVAAALFSAALAYPFFWLVGSGEAVVICVAFILSISFALYGMSGSQGALLAAAFPARTRYLGHRSHPRVLRGDLRGHDPPDRRGAAHRQRRWHLDRLCLRGADVPDRRGCRCRAATPRRDQGGRDPGRGEARPGVARANRGRPHHPDRRDLTEAIS